MSGGNVRVKLTIFVVITVVAVLITAAVLCESLGVFPGSLLNYIAVHGYIERNYPDLDYSLARKYYSKAYDGYYFNFTSSEGDFHVAAKGMKVKYDGYYHDYLRDTDLLNSLSGLIKNQIYEKAPVEDAEFIGRIKKGEYSGEGEALKTLKGKYELVITVSGNKLTFDAYKSLAADYAAIIAELGYEPSFLRVFYERIPEGNAADNPIMQYESGIKGELLKLDKNILVNSRNTHFIVELDEKQERNYRVFTYFQRFYLVFLFASIIILGGVWFIRRYRKLKKR